MVVLSRRIDIDSAVRVETSTPDHVLLLAIVLRYSVLRLVAKQSCMWTLPPYLN
jgi:hypothetical protein